VVRQHFKITEKDNAKPIKSVCRYCAKEFTCQTKNGTSSMSKHIDKICKKKPRVFPPNLSRHLQEFIPLRIFLEVFYIDLFVSQPVNYRSCNLIHTPLISTLKTSIYFNKTMIITMTSIYVINSRKNKNDHHYISHHEFITNKISNMIVTSFPNLR
jgi:hypothetical protein